MPRSKFVLRFYVKQDPIPVVGNVLNAAYEMQLINL